MKKIISALMLVTFLASCTSTPETAVQKEPTKIAFPIETRDINSFAREYSVEKTGRLVGSSSISLSAQGTGRVESVLVKEGATVRKGQVLVRMKDTTANYDLRLSQAKNALLQTKNLTASTKMTLDKAVEDAALAVKRAETDLESAEENAQNNYDKAKRDAEKSNLWQEASDANVTLAQLQASLDKAKIDYQNLIVSNQQTLKNYNSSYQTTLSDLKKFYSKIVFEGDRLYGITPKFQTENTAIRPFIWGWRNNLWTTLEFAFFEIEKVEKLVASQNADQVDETTLLARLDELSSHYKSARSYLDAAGKYLENSTVWTEFPQSKLDALMATNNGYKSELSGLEASWVNFKNSASTFLANYRNNETSAASALIVQEKNIEVQKRQLASTQFDTGINLSKIETANTQSVTNAKIALENARLAYDTSVKNRVLTLEKLKISENDAGIALEQSEREYEKLSIIAPIDGSITRVLASVGQDVAPGTLMVELANRNPEILFDVEANVAKLLEVGSTQNVQYQGKSYSGVVVGVSEVATDSLLYSARIKLKETVDLLGQVASISLEIPTQYRVVPMDVVRVLSERKGEIQAYANGETKGIEVELGRIVGSSVEILSDMPEGTQIVMTNLSNYDPKKSFLQASK